jgi:S1-C subfamily serine protease
VADPFVATVEAVAHDCDLAILRVNDPAFWKGVGALKLGGIPKARTKVTTYGFPLGGEEVSSTSGIVSRVDWKPYAHTGIDSHLVVQTDAAINPGNSGGPVIQDGKVVGVAFQGIPGADNVGFFIPSTLIQHFLKDVEDGTYHGYPDDGLHTLDLISPATRRERKVPAGLTGVVVQSVAVGGTADGWMVPGDVLVAVDGQAIANDGTIPLQEARVPYSYLLDMHQIGEPVRFSVWRDGKRVEVKAPSRRIARGDRARSQYDQAPRYLVYAGMVFMTLDVEYLRTWGQDWRTSAPRELQWHHLFREWEVPAQADREVVVLARVLKHPVNSQLASNQGAVVARVNGREVTGLQDVAAALDQGSGGFHVFEFETSGIVDALQRQKADAAHTAIMKTYGISRDRNL